MSTKNLARTIIEGGRHKGNKWERRNSHAIERAHVRNYIKEVTLDPENYEEYDAEPIEHVYKGFDDKLGPIYRWLRRQVGRPWDEVRADISATFDIRTTAGRHIVFDHMLTSVQVGDQRGRYYYGPDDSTTSYSDHDFYVDDDGILQKKRYIGRRRYHEKVPEWDTKQLANWLNGRIVGKVGNKLFWFTPVGKAKKHRGMGHAHIWKIVWGHRGYYYYYSASPHFQYLTYENIYKLDGNGMQVLDDKGAPVVLDRIAKWVNASTPPLRQHRKLNEKELAYWNSLPQYYQTKILELSPNYPEELKPKPRYYY